MIAINLEPLQIFQNLPVHPQTPHRSEQISYHFWELTYLHPRYVFKQGSIFQGGISSQEALENNRAGHPQRMSESYQQATLKAPGCLDPSFPNHGSGKRLPRISVPFSFRKMIHFHDMGPKWKKFPGKLLRLSVRSHPPR